MWNWCLALLASHFTCGVLPRQTRWAKLNNPFLQTLSGLADPFALPWSKYDHMWWHLDLLLFCGWLLSWSNHFSYLETCFSCIRWHCITFCAYWTVAEALLYHTQFLSGQWTIVCYIKDVSNHQKPSKKVINTSEISQSLFY